jgi:hypothetical protein
MKRELKKDIIEKGADLQLTFDLLFGPSLIWVISVMNLKKNGENRLWLKVAMEKVDIWYFY